ncbi:MAG: CaiB/BaiF CoA transferase family protein [Dehalococcoidia bacterium]
MFPDVPNTGLPLSGLRVIDCTHWQQGPYCSTMLGQFGADVIKVEGPDSPDPGRGLGAARTGPNAYFESHNHNKRSLVVDLKHPLGREAILRLAETADVFVQNMRQGVMDRLGLAYGDLRERNPRIIYASGSGYGHEGPHARWAAMDMLAQARGGTMMTQGSPDDAPFFSFGGMADQVGALYLCNGILMALWHRARTGEGQEVNGSLLGGQVALQAFNITGTLFTGNIPPQATRMQRAPLWNVYECADGRFLALAMAQYDRWWPRLMAALDAPSLRDNPDYATLATAAAHFPAIIRELDAIFATRPQEAWQLYLAGDCGLAVASVQDYGQVAADPMAHANHFFVDYPNPDFPGLKMVGPGALLSRTPGSVRTPAPEFGQHSEEVLLEAGYSWDEISELRAAGALG